MNYVIVTIEWCLSHGIIVPDEARKSLDGTKVILHEGFIDPVLSNKERIPIYRHDNSELTDILNSAEWSSPEGDETV